MSLHAPRQLDIESLARQLRANDFGVHLYSYGDDLWHMQLIDWRVKPPADSVVWQTMDALTFADAWEATFVAAHQHRHIWKPS